MRISDWSSDVCSSDLRPRSRRRAGRLAARRPGLLSRPCRNHGGCPHADPREPALDGDKGRTARRCGRAFYGRGSRAAGPRHQIFGLRVMVQTVFIDGAAGTTGLEIAERLAGRSEFALVTLPDAERKDAARRTEALNDADFVILCLPDDAAREAVAMIANDRTRRSEEQREGKECVRTFRSRWSP